MDRPFHVSRSAAQLVRRRFPIHENIKDSTPACSTFTRIRQKEGTKDQASLSRRTNIEYRICEDGSVRTCQATHEILHRHVDIFDQCPTGLDSFKPATTPRTQNTSQYVHHLLRLDRQKRVSYPSSRRRFLDRSTYHASYIPLGRGHFTCSMCSFAPNRWISERSFSISATSAAVLESHQTIFSRDDQPPFQSYELGATESKIRERMRLWEAAHRAQLDAEFDYQKLQLNKPLTKHDQADIFDEGVEEYEFHNTFNPAFDREDIVDLGKQKPFLLRGDMVELRASNCFKVELAIFVRLIDSQSQYYTMSGKWIHQSMQAPKFCVPGFVDTQELDPILAFLPSAAIPEALQHKLHDFEHALPRDVGAPLIKKMLGFWRESDRIYRETAFKLDNAHGLVANKSSLRYATLSELALKLLPKNYLKNDDFPDPVLYALHRSLVLNALGFRSQKWRHRITNQFEITSIDEIEMIRAVGDDVRRYQKYLINSTQGVQTPSTDPVAQFAETARRLIQASRRTRQYTPHGMIGPAGRKGGYEANADHFHVSNNQKKRYFKELDQRYIRFIESWAALLTFNGHSYLHGIASAILRATGMYEDQMLDQRVGWTFLQEIGAIAPWETRVLFDMRLPVTRQLTRDKSRHTATLNTSFDVLTGLRKDWGDLPVYCIDASGANEIDDGVSIEPTELPDEHWVHVHVADPASMIVPRSTIAQNALSAIHSTYFPDRIIGMLPSDVVQEHLSLAPDRRCLTFSARINSNGKLLDMNITPGVVRNVLYMTPATLSTTVGETPSLQETVITVGSHNTPTAMKSHRQVLERHEIPDLDKRNLRKLFKLGKARQLLSSANGSVMSDWTPFSISAVTDTKVEERPNGLKYIQCTSDPRIDFRVGKPDPDVTRSYGDTVMSLMLLAGEVGARWCQERGVPIINRISQSHPDDPDPRVYFRRVIMPLINRPKESCVGGRNSIGKVEESYKLSREKTYSSESQEEDSVVPKLSEAFKILPISIALEYQRLIGVVTNSTTPRPHRHLGLDLFARTTSPLRRYGDLLNHWQIEAALLEEARSGQSLIGSTRDDYLPFKRNEVERLIPHFSQREKELRCFERNSQRAWIMQLILRAWKFNEAPLPATFELWIDDIETKTVRGDLPYFGNLYVEFDLPTWLRIEDIQIGDVFEVKLAELDVYSNRVTVEPLRRVRRTTERAI